MDPQRLSRFLDAQRDVYATVLAELRHGRKRSHWMWFIFPQLDGLGHSGTARFYAIRDLEEARAYLAHPVLGPRLMECVAMVVDIDGKSATDILGHPDDMKLRSCATLFAQVSPPESLFARLLEKYYEGRPDGRTLELLGG